MDEEIKDFLKIYYKEIIPINFKLDTAFKSIAKKYRYKEVALGFGFIKENMRDLYFDKIGIVEHTKEKEEDNYQIYDIDDDTWEINPGNIRIEYVNKEELIDFKFDKELRTILEKFKYYETESFFDDDSYSRVIYFLNQEEFIKNQITK